MSGFAFLRCEVEGAIATVHLHRPPVNAVHQPMYRELHALFSDIGQLGGGVRVVVLTGDGDHFCAGNDLDEFSTMTTENGRERMFHVREAFWAIDTCAVPVVAAVGGVALGTGLAIAASCDLVVASDDARFGLPEITVGVMGGARHAARLLPPSLVRLLFYTGDPLPAAELHRLGGVIEVVARSDLMPTARRYAERIARHSPVALRHAKETLTRIEDMDLRRGYEYEQSRTVALADHPHAKEAVRSVIDKRAPRYDPV